MTSHQKGDGVLLPGDDAVTAAAAGGAPDPRRTATQAAVPAAPDPWAPPRQAPPAHHSSRVGGSHVAGAGHAPPPYAPPPGAGGYPLPIPPQQPPSPDPARFAPPGYAYAPPPGAFEHTPPPAHASWGPWEVAQPRRTSAWAIATLVLSLTFWPAVLVTGPIALSKTRRGREGGRGLAIAGVTLATIWTVVTAVAIAVVVFSLANGSLAGLASGGAGAAPGTAAEVRHVPVGSCFALEGNKNVTVDCALPHDGELFFTGHVMGTGTVGYPGEPLLVAEAEEMCHAAFSMYVGLDYEDSQWHYAAYVPDSGAWANGDREAACAIVPFGPVPLVGSAAGSGV